MNHDRPVALVTGSGGALGSEMCKQFLEDGYDVVVSDLREDAANDVAEKLDSSGERVFTVAIDVGSTQSVDAGIEAVIHRFGRLDVLVNNAGNFRQGWTKTYSDEDWRFVTNVHLDGAFRCCRAAFPHLKPSYPDLLWTPTWSALLATSQPCKVMFCQVRPLD